MYIDYVLCTSLALHHSCTLEGIKIILIQGLSMKVSLNSCIKTTTASQFYISKLIPQAFLSRLPHKLLKEPKRPTSLSKKMLTPFGLVFLINFTSLNDYFPLILLAKEEPTGG